MRNFANRFRTIVDDRLTRIDFFDNINGIDTMTASVVMSNDDAKALGDAIMHTQAQHEALKAEKQ